jgi:predicted XRE-type DNA-binding protein
LNFKSDSDMICGPAREVRTFPADHFTTATLIGGTAVPQELTDHRSAIQSSLDVIPDPYDSDPWSCLRVVFRPLAQWPGYGIDTLGNLWSRKRVGHRGGLINAWRPMTVRPSRYGYMLVDISHEGRTVQKLVHRLVLETFVGPCPENMECCHRDGDATNNRLDNLRWDTRAANSQDSRELGSLAVGSRIATAKLKESQISGIFELRRSGMSQREIAGIYGVHQAQVSRILARKAWSHA